MTGTSTNTVAALWHRIRRYALSCERAIFGEGIFAFFAFGMVIAIWAFELVMNIRNGNGWVAAAHLAVVGPLWVAITGLTLLALYRRVTGAARPSGARQTRMTEECET